MIVAASDSAEISGASHAPGRPRSKSTTPPDAGVATRGKPAAAASSRALGIPSWRDGSTSSVASGKNAYGRSTCPAKQTAVSNPSSLESDFKAVSS
jgi:hypothetical protein